MLIGVSVGPPLPDSSSYYDVSGAEAQMQRLTTEQEAKLVTKGKARSVPN